MVSLSGDIDDRTVFTQPRTLINQDDNRQPATDKKRSKLQPAITPIVEVKASKRPAIVVTNNPDPDTKTKAKTNQNEEKLGDKADAKEANTTKDKDMDKRKEVNKNKEADKNNDVENNVKDVADKPEDPKVLEKPADKEATKQEGYENKNNENNNRVSRFKARPDPLFFLSGPHGDRIEYRMDERTGKRRMYLVMHKKKKKEPVAANKPPEVKTSPRDAEKDKKILELEKKIQESQTKVVEVKETPQVRIDPLDAEKDRKILELEKKLEEMEIKAAEVKESVKRTADLPSGKEKEQTVNEPLVEDHKGTKKKDQQSRKGEKPAEEEQPPKDSHTKTTVEDVKSTNENPKNVPSVRGKQSSQVNGEANPATKSQAKEQDGEAQSTTQEPGKNVVEKTVPDQVIDNKLASGVKFPVSVPGQLWKHNDIWNDVLSDHNIGDCFRKSESSPHSNGHAESTDSPHSIPVAAGSREEPSKVNVLQKSPISSRSSQGQKSHASNKSKLSGFLEFTAGRRGILPGPVLNRPHVTRSKRSKPSTKKSSEQSATHVISDVMRGPVVAPREWYPIPIYVPVYPGPTARATMGGLPPYSPHVHSVQQPHHQPGHAFPQCKNAEPPSPEQSPASHKTLSSRSIFSTKNPRLSEIEGSSTMSTPTLEPVYNTIRDKEDHNVSRRRERAETAWNRERNAKKDRQDYNSTSQRSRSRRTKKENHLNNQEERLRSSAQDKSDIQSKHKEKHKQKGSLRNYGYSQASSQTTLNPSDSASMKRSAVPRGMQLQLRQRSDLSSPEWDARSSSDFPDGYSDSSAVRTLHTEGSNYRAPFVETVNSDKGRISGTVVKDDDPFADDHTIHQTAHGSFSDRFLTSGTGASVQERSDASGDERHYHSRRKSQRSAIRNLPSQPYDFYPYHDLISKDNPSPLKKSGASKSAASQFNREDAQKIKHNEPPRPGSRRFSPRRTVPMEAEKSINVIPVVGQMRETKQRSKNDSETIRRNFSAVPSTSKTPRRRSSPMGGFSETSSRFSSSQTYRRNVDRRHNRERYSSLSSRDSQSESSLDWSQACNVRAKHGRKSSISRADSQIHPQ